MSDTLRLTDCVSERLKRSLSLSELLFPMTFPMNSCLDTLVSDSERGVNQVLFESLLGFTLDALVSLIHARPESRSREQQRRSRCQAE